MTQSAPQRTPSEWKAARAWQRMLSGRRLDLLNPDPADIALEDIAHGLARVARWNGQTIGDHAFSVAEHSVIVLTIFNELNPQASTDERKLALLHDAAEYVVGDLISPFKVVIGGHYKECEQRLLRAIRIAFDLQDAATKDLEAQIKKADSIAAWYEATLLAGFTKEEANQFFGAPPTLSDNLSALLTDLKPTHAAEAEQTFKNAYASFD